MGLAAVPESSTTTQPAVYDMPDAEYHADPVPEGSLSVSGAKVILDSPAKFRWQLDHGRPDKPEHDLGHAAHAALLGMGAEVVVIDAEEWRTAAVKAQVAEARAAGKTPVRPSQAAAVAAMVAEVRAHPIAGPLFREGKPEVSLFNRDEATRVMLRARLDWLTTWRDGRPVVVDYKTTTNADPDAFRWDAGKFGYHMQDCWYRELAEAVLGEPHLFLFVVQEKTPPYLLSVCEMDDDARDVGTQRNRVARRIYLDCRTRDEWPGYAPVIHSLRLPRAGYAIEPEGLPA